MTITGRNESLAEIDVGAAAQWSAFADSEGVELSALIGALGTVLASADLNDPIRDLLGAAIAGART